MEKINHAEFKKKVFKKGKFEQYIVSPYASQEKHTQEILLFSDKVSEPVYHTYRQKKIALILPYSDDPRKAVADHIEAIQEHTRVQASYFGLFDLLTGELIAIS